MEENEPTVNHGDIVSNNNLQLKKSKHASFIFLKFKQK